MAGHRAPTLFCHFAATHGNQLCGRAVRFENLIMAALQRSDNSRVTGLPSNRSEQYSHLGSLSRRIAGPEEHLEDLERRIRRDDKRTGAATDVENRCRTAQVETRHARSCLASAHGSLTLAGDPSSPRSQTRWTWAFKEVSNIYGLANFGVGVVNGSSNPSQGVAK